MNKEETVIQNYLCSKRFYETRYNGNGYLYHKFIIDEMMKSISGDILDVGCGVGFLSQLYPHLDILGIDNSTKMLEQNPYKWIMTPAENMPFVNERFDSIICRSLLHHIEHPPFVLGEMFRVLKHGGKISFWETNFSILNNFIRKIAKYTRRFSHLHKNFKSEELMLMIDRYFNIVDIQYHGYIAYCLLGYPDIVKFPIPPKIADYLIRLDNYISKTYIKKLGWGILIKAEKM